MKTELALYRIDRNTNMQIQILEEQLKALEKRIEELEKKIEELKDDDK